MNLAWIHSRRQIKGKHSVRCPYIFFTLVTRSYFMLRIVQKWRFKMGPLSSLSCVCTEYLTQKYNTNRVRLEY